MQQNKTLLVKTSKQKQEIKSSPIKKGFVNTTITLLSLLDKTLLEELEYLNTVTNRLQQRIHEVRSEFTQENISDNFINSSNTKEIKSNSSTIIKQDQEEEEEEPKQQKNKKKNNNESLLQSNEPPLIISFTPSHSQKRKTEKKLQFTSPRKIISNKVDDENNDESEVLTSLMSFEFTPQPKEIKKQEITDESNFKDLDKLDSSLYSSNSLVEKNPLVVELQNSDVDHNIKFPKNIMMNYDNCNIDSVTNHENAKQELFQARLISVEQDLNKYLSDLLLLQRDILDAHKRELINSNDLNIRELRLSIRDEINDCSTRMSFMKSLQSITN